jgi:hypothetical protein
MWLAVAAAGLAASLFADRIPFNQGFGFEAFSIYKPLTEQLPEYVRERRIDSYTIQRVLPFVTAHYTIRAFGLPLGGPSILGFFHFWNAAVLALSVWLWLRVARDDGISPAGQWLGFVGLFANFAAMKLPFYYPVNLDTTALLLGLAALHFHRRDSLPGLLATGLLGIFVWPTQIVVVSLLLLMPRSLRWPEAPPPPSRRNRLLLLLLAALAAAGLAYALYGVGARPQSGGAEAVRSLLPLSLAAASTYLYLGLLALVGPLELQSAAVLRACRSLLAPRRLSAVALLWAVHWLATHVLAAPGPPRLTLYDYLVKYVSLGAAARPGQFLVAHVAYFGPVLLLLVVRWSAVAQAIRELGAGLVACAALAVVLGVNSESRQLVNFLPLLVLPTVLVGERTGANRLLLPGLAAFALLLSKVWFPVNYAVPGLGEDGALFPTGAGSFLAFPAQAYFMNFGPWMSNAMFTVHAAVVLAMGTWIIRSSLRAGVNSN